MRHLRIAVFALLPLALAGCWFQHQPLVAVPSGIFRTEKKAEMRISLPLNSDGRRRIENFLLAEGNTDNIDKQGNVTTTNDPGAKVQWQGLLDELSPPHHPTVEDLEMKHTYKKWLRGTVVYGVVDARDEASPPEPPVAIRGDMVVVV